MAQQPPPNPALFQAQNVANSFTNIGNHLGALQNESHNLVQEFALLGNAAPVALAQLTQTCNQILQNVQRLTQDNIELKAQSHNLRARQSNSVRLRSDTDPIDQLHNVSTNLPIAGFPPNLGALRALGRPAARSILTAIGLTWQNADTVYELRNQIRIEIGCREPA